MDSNATVSRLQKWSSILSRRKTEDESKEERSNLARVLGLMDLTALGVGSTLGLGVYVLAGSVAKTDAGPAVSISFLIAAIASGFAALCYAEFAARVPKAGSAYVYSYVTVGEFAAFLIGWNLILEYAIGTASVAKGLSNYVDTLCGQMMQREMRLLFPINISFLSPYPDFFACGIVLLLTFLLCWGVKESSTINNVFTTANLLTVGTVMVAGCFKANPSNWAIRKVDIPEAFSAKAGEGGFIPFGWAGVMAGAAKCFYGFVGFDAIATTGEEAKDPKRDIPLSIILSLFIIFFAYFGVATVLTMMIPYYEQDPLAPLPHAFNTVNWPIISWIVSGGAIFALCTSLLGAIFPLPRILYSMSSDGLIFQIFSKVSPKTKTPVVATLISGSLGGLVAGIFDLDQLINMMSIGTLLAYTIVAISILLLRYEEEPVACFQKEVYNTFPTNVWEKSDAIWTCEKIIKSLFNLTNAKTPTSTTQYSSRLAIFMFCVANVILCYSYIYLEDVVSLQVLYGPAMVIFSTFSLFTFLILLRQPQSTKPLHFKVPLVPLIPCASIFMNTFLMLKLDTNTWIRFGIWLILGLMVYFFYGLSHSVEGRKKDNIISNPPPKNRSLGSKDVAEMTNSK